MAKYRKTALIEAEQWFPAASDYYQEYIDRATGRTPSVIGIPYWD